MNLRGIYLPPLCLFHSLRTSIQCRARRLHTRRNPRRPCHVPELRLQLLVTIIIPCSARRRLQCVHTAFLQLLRLTRGRRQGTHILDVFHFITTYTPRHRRRHEDRPSRRAPERSVASQGLAERLEFQRFHFRTFI